MSRIRSKNTKTEILVRRGLHARGFRFRLQDKKLPGSPDIVLPKYGVVIMVNGCFWHGHAGCRYATRPKSNVEFWELKIARNRYRDEVVSTNLEALGWKVITVWECELRTANAAESRLDSLADELRRSVELKRERDDIRRKSRLQARKDREEMLRRHAALEAEIDAICPVPKKVRKASMEECPS